VDHPGSEFQDDAQFYLIDSQYNYAVNRFPSLIPERLKIAKDYYDIFANRYADSEYKSQADELLVLINDYNN
jgi:outer membrane protein assembly factor BamD